jgi:hypothetical protein
VQKIANRVIKVTLLSGCLCSCMTLSVDIRPVSADTYEAVPNGNTFQTDSRNLAAAKRGAANFCKKRGKHDMRIINEAGTRVLFGCVD